MSSSPNRICEPLIGQQLNTLVIPLTFLAYSRSGRGPATDGFEYFGEQLDIAGVIIAAELRAFRGYHSGRPE